MIISDSITEVGFHSSIYANFQSSPSQIWSNSSNSISDFIICLYDFSFLTVNSDTINSVILMLSCLFQAECLHIT